jgi:hypothetical protein
VGLSLDAVSGTFTQSRGVRLLLLARHAPAIFSNDFAFSKVRAEVSAAYGAKVLTDVFLNVHVEAERNWGHYPFFEAAFIGGSSLPPALNLTGQIIGSPLPGYDNNRFAGDSSVAANAELRIAIGRFTALLPFRYGLLALGDVGRVFLVNESSSRWHPAGGGGVWLAVFASAWTFQVASSINLAVVRSDEQTSFYVTSGFGL